MIRARFERTATRVPLPAWAIAVVAAWLALLAAAEVLRPVAAGDFTLCNWRNLTGVPCPTCGTTRLVRAAAAGRPIDAILQNPFMGLAAALGVTWLAPQILFRRRLRVHMPRRARRAAWAILAAAFLANWSYLLLRHAE